MAADGGVKPGFGGCGLVGEVGDEGEEDGAVDIQGFRKAGVRVREKMGQAHGGVIVGLEEYPVATLNGGTSGADGGEDGVDFVGVAFVDFWEDEADAGVLVVDADGAGGFLEVEG